MLTAAGTVCLVALVTVVASLGYLHVAPTGLSPVRNAVSQYGITRFRAGYRVATIAFGVGGIALAVGIDRAVAPSGRSLVVVLLLIFAVARLAISWFPMDAPGTPPTQTGRRHGLLAIAAFLTRDCRRLQARRPVVAQDAMARPGDGVGGARIRHGRLPVGNGPRAFVTRPAGALRARRARLLRLGDRLVRRLRRRLRPERPLKATPPAAPGRFE